MSWSGRKIRALANQVVGMYGAVCWLCKQPIDLSVDRREPGGMSVDHVIPRSKGGGDSLDNLRPAHRACNVRRQARPASQFRPPRPVLVRPGWPGLT